MIVKAYATYGSCGGWVIHINKWYETDSVVWVDESLL